MRLNEEIVIETFKGKNYQQMTKLTKDLWFRRQYDPMGLSAPPPRL